MDIVESNGENIGHWREQLTLQITMERTLDIGENSGHCIEEWREHWTEQWREHWTL